MKQNNIVTVLIVAIIGIFVAYFGLNNLLKVNDRKFEYYIVSPIESTLATPDPEVFNPGALNPTIEVFIGNCVDVDKNGIIDSFELEECEKQRKQGAGAEKDKDLPSSKPENSDESEQQRK